MTGAGGEALFREAHALHKQGNFSEAERLYARVLEQQPGHAHALHFLGVLALQKGQSQKGVELIARAVEIEPNFAAAHNNLGGGYRKLQRPEEALASFARAIALRPDYAQAYFSRGLVLQDMTRLAEAAADFDRAVALNPSHAQAFYHRGNALADLKRPLEALVSYDRAIALEPGHAEAHHDRGLVLAALGRFEEALASYDRAIALTPGVAELYSNRGLALTKLERFEEALASHDEAISRRPAVAEAHNNRATALKELRRFEEAVASYDQAIALKPDFAGAYSNRGFALNELKRPAEAMADFDRAIALQPDFAEAYSNRGLALTELRQLDQALASYEAAIALKPGFIPAHWNKSQVLLLTGQFEQGWRLYEYRKNLDQPVGSQTYPRPLWLGEEEIKGKTLLIHAEQGLGDLIQFCRYALLAEARGARVVIAARAAMVRLLKTLGPTVRIVEWTAIPAEFDFHIPLLSLPLACRTGIDSIPVLVPYLRAEPDRVARWKEKIEEGGFKVGICWQGSKKGAELGKPFSLAQFRRIAQIPGVRLISLQKGEGGEQLGNLPPGMNVEDLGDGFDAGPDAFLDSAAVMESLDLIITTDTSIAHLAGALGRPTWVALKYVPDWRWLLDRSDSPWYPTMRLFRQTSYDSWPGAFALMEAHLRALIGQNESD